MKNAEAKCNEDAYLQFYQGISLQVARKILSCNTTISISLVTGKPSSSPTMSSIFFHCHQVNFDDFTLTSIASLVFSGKPVEHHEDIKDTIKSLRHEIHKVQHFIDHLSQDVIHNKKSQSKGWFSI